ncbi:MAG: DUF2695 domain-containing protein [Planctomycetaceae bacterium]
MDSQLSVPRDVRRYASESTPMAKLSKEERKARLKQWQAAERTDLVASMPLSPQQLNSLLDYVDANLKSCDHTTKLTDIFLHVEQLDKDHVLPWLADHGGYCDCEVLYNLEDFAESFRERSIPPKPKPKTKRVERDLATLMGWDFAGLPQPWRIANLYAANEPLKLQMGKKGGCTITVLESPLAPGDQMSDDYWSALWYARTELPQKSPIQVTRAALDLPDHLQSILVQTSGWLPVYCWVVSNNQQWHLEIRTELNRRDGDLPQVAKLVTQLATNKA